MVMAREKLNLRSKSRGVSLVEVLVALGISAFILAGVFKVMIDGKNAFYLEQESAYVQENARYILDRIAYDFRSMTDESVLGRTLCPNGNFANTVDPTKVPVLSSGFTGVDSTEVAAAASSILPNNIKAWIKPGTDAILIPQELLDSGAVVDTVDAGGKITTVNPHGRGAGANLVAGVTFIDAMTGACTQLSVFPVETVGVTDNQFQPDAGAYCTSELGGSFDCSNHAGNSSVLAIPAGSQIYLSEALPYYIKSTDANGAITPALFRGADELIRGVENMQITYGVDTDVTLLVPDGDGSPNIYRSAASGQMTGVAPYLWGNIVTVRISLVLRSIKPVYQQAETATFLGITYNDKYYRQEFTTTITLRNRGLSS